jgi:hypothetical protein
VCQQQWDKVGPVLLLYAGVCCFDEVCRLRHVAFGPARCAGCRCTCVGSFQYLGML